ncbi:PfkB family carbohydrate kinase [Shewanella schlegeliana]|uniref:Ribokinase n=1 Tax=Shewanella schlegeliana TaxID=190308 RepID=A0ABS1T481_9GAMM|nr:PfkB family carbohydrate kinase [Shewanella schlegeliana]MBL4914657.1 ribokinase [Shewanella schlegeliana]MCL1110011.1 PfkB family carbohydrate kinase [Shewanella schlegeliana]GIU25231.1 ribokinase [Shewanella schlegeliana]
MANILLVANLNCDRIFLLNHPIKTGGRFHYKDGGQRLGGGGANTGIGLVWAGHQVSLVTEVGRDDVGDWLLAEASTQGINCSLIQRRAGNTCEMLLMMTPDGERTIIRPERPKFELPLPPNWHDVDALYINSSTEGAASWSKTAMAHCLVVAQLAKDERARPCHVLIASLSDMQDRCDRDRWTFAKTIAGDNLEYFVVTDGEKGAMVYSDAGCEHVAAVPSQVVDTTGAGDAYAAGLIHGLVSNKGIIESMEEAAIWSGFAVSCNSSIPGKGLKGYLIPE